MKNFLVLAVFVLSFMTVLEGWAASYGLTDVNARDTPVEVEKSVPELVTYLTKDLTSAEDKARAIAVWIAYHIDFDDYKQKRMENQDETYIPENNAEEKPFTTRVATSYGFATLFKEMAEAAGLQAAVINGNYKGFRASSPAKGNAGASKSQKYRSNWYWNAVSDGENWHLLDTAIAADGLNMPNSYSSDRAYVRDMNKKEEQGEYLYLKIAGKIRSSKTLKDNDLWFFVKPQNMIKTHFPLNPKWQLLTPPKQASSFFAD